MTLRILLQLAKLVITYLMPGRKVFVFSGLRRSGNHAIIHWVINGLENQSTEYHSVGPYWFSVSGSGKTVFLNNVNMVPPLRYLKALFKYRKYLRNAEQIFISCEDTGFEYFRNWRIPSAFRHGVIIRRSLLNILASRLQNLKKHAESGVGWSGQTIDTGMFDALLSLDQAPDNRFTKIRYDDWLTDSEYRKIISSKLGMKSDIKPEISKEGGGSSFTGREIMPSDVELKQRFQQIKFPERVLKFLNDPKYASLMTPEEQSVIAVQITGGSYNQKLSSLSREKSGISCS